MSVGEFFFLDITLLEGNKFPLFEYEKLGFCVCACAHMWESVSI